MSVVYRKSLKGIDEVAFRSSGLPMRMVSYLLAVDGESGVDQLAPVGKGWSRLKMFPVLGWAIYPMGLLITLISNSPDMRIARALIYNFAESPGTGTAQAILR